MQTPKGRAVTLEVPQRTSPATPRTARQLKTSGSEADSTSSHPASRTPKDRSPKVLERKSPRSPVTERKRPSKISALESQLAQIQEDLKKAKDQLGSSESSKRHAQQETEELKKQLINLSEKHEDCRHQLLDLSASEEDRLQELRKISQERDKAWESELEAVHKQQSAESAALASALNEIQRLKIQLETVIDAEAFQSNDVEKIHTELQNSQLDLANAHSLIENLKVELNSCKESEVQAQAMVGDTLRQLESARITVETLRSDGIKTMEACNSLSLELEQSRERVKSLEAHVSKLQSDLANASRTHLRSEIGETEQSEQAKVEYSSMELEIGDLRLALDALQTKYQEEQIKNTIEIRGAYDLVEELKSKTGVRETELDVEVKRTKAHIEELKANLMDKETELQSILEENEGLNMKVEKTISEMEVNKSKSDIAELKATLMEKEARLNTISEENEILKSEIKKKETESTTKDETAEATLMKLGHVTQEVEKSTKRAERATEQLEAVQAANSEMEAELRRLKVQSDQWRKAAEAAAAVLSAGNNNAKCMERSGSLDSNYHPITGTICSPYSEDMEDDSPKKKNMLKKLGSLWKKGQK